MGPNGARPDVTRLSGIYCTNKPANKQNKKKLRYIVYKLTKNWLLQIPVCNTAKF